MQSDLLDYVGQDALHVLLHPDLSALSLVILDQSIQHLLELLVDVLVYAGLVYDIPDQLQVML